MEYSEEVKKLAETLKNSGLAASMRDALEKAQSMLGKKGAEEEKAEEEPFERETDAAQTTLGEVEEPKEKEAISESSEAEEELKKEEVFANKQRNEPKEEPNQSKANPQQKKIDLTKVFDVNK